MATLMSLVERNALRYSDDYRQLNRIWHKEKYGCMEAVGNPMELIKQCNPKSLKEFELYYFQTGRLRQEIYETKGNNIKQYEKKMLDALYGRSYKELLNIAYKMRREAIYLPIDILYNFVYIKVIDDTYTGYEREEIVITSLINELIGYKGFFVRHSTMTEDVSMAIDVEVCQWGKVVCGIQVKSARFKDINKNSVKYKQTASKKMSYRKINDCEVYDAYVNEYNLVENINELVDNILVSTKSPVVKKRQNRMLVY